MITVKINNVDKTNLIEYRSFNLARNLTSQVDIFQFSIVQNGDYTYKPAILDTILVEQDGSKLFGGVIIEMKERVEGKDILVTDCYAKDYSYDMDRLMVIAKYEDMSVNDIITDLKTNYLGSAYDISNVYCELAVRFIAFNYEYPSKCLQQLAELTGYDWYVDADKKIYFFSKTQNLAPFNLTDDGDNFYYNSLTLRRDLANLRNTIIVRGGEYKGDLTSEKLSADGQGLIYKQGQRYSDVFVKVNNVTKTIGTDNISDPASFDCLYNFQEKFVRFKDTTKPASGHTVEVGGLPHIPVIVKVKDPDSIAKYGVHEFKVVDKSIISKNGARDRAKAEIQSWAEKVSEGSFETSQSGLEVGQCIMVNSVIRGISNEPYIINKITTTLRNGLEPVHSVSLMTNQTYGMVEFLQKLLINKDKEIEINENEVLDEIESLNDTISVTETGLVVAKGVNTFTETMSVSESSTVQALNYPVEFVLSPVDPSGYKRPFKLNGSPLSG